MMARFTFDIDEEYARKNNELLKDTRRLQLSALIFALIQIAIGVGVWLYLDKDAMGWIVLICFAVMALLTLSLTVIIPKKVGDPHQLYNNYDLAPAIVAKVNPRDVVLLALVNTSMDSSQKPRWALAARTVTNIHGHHRRVGERVPSVAVTGQRSAGSDWWDQITPMPIAWATKDEATIRRAEKQIPHEQWKKLEKNIGQLDKVRDTKFDLLPLT